MRRSVAFRASCAHHADSTRGERDMRVASVHLRHMLAASIAVTLVSAATNFSPRRGLSVWHGMFITRNL